MLDYEEALTRQDSHTNKWYDCSSHLVWLGYRTGKIDSAHVEFLSGIHNPIGIKVGKNTKLKELVSVIKKINPSNEIGKIILILRYGKNEIKQWWKNYIHQFDSINF